jgi:hypothetical protein
MGRETKEFFFFGGGLAIKLTELGRVYFQNVCTAVATVSS